MSGIISFKDNPLTLVGRTVTEGTESPNFRVISQELEEVDLSKFGKKIKVITSFPSLDTPVCDLQVREFNKRSTGFSSDVAILGISKDLPFAQKRFCQMNEIKNVTVLSDYKFSSFGINYGLLIKELNLLARAIVILDSGNVARYVQVVKELTSPPDYEDVLKNLNSVISSPGPSGKEKITSRCRPCEEGMRPLSKEIVDNMIAQRKDWLLVDGKKIVKEFIFKDFIEAKYFLDLISVVAEEQGHHPTITLIYNKLKITLTTHAAGGLTENDLIVAGIIDELI